MEKPLSQLFKEYFSFLRKDRNSTIGMSVLIVLVLLGHYILNSIEFNTSSDYSEFERALEKWENESACFSDFRTLFEFDPNIVSEEKLDSLAIPSNLVRNLLSYRAAGGKFSRPSDIRRIYGMNDSIFSVIEPFILLPQEVSSLDNEKAVSSTFVSGTFDPNTASADELNLFGFNRFQTSNLVKYRQSGGRFSRPGDLLKIFGIDSVFFESIETRIQIEGNPEVIHAVQESTPLLKVELNAADSLQLVSLRGIGPVYASRILKYRELLGGFYSDRQLLEVYGFPRETHQALIGNILVDTMKVKKLRINFAEYSELIQHPYIEKVFVEAVLDYRRKNGPFTSNNQILEAGLMDSSVFVLLNPYLTCR